MNQQAQLNYMKNQVTTASPGELTLMLYNGCIKFMKQALIDLEHNDFMAKNVSIKKAQNIIDELIITLKMEYEVSKSLKALYVFINEQLFNANVNKDTSSLHLGIELVTELRDTWAEALKVVKTNPQKVTS